MNLFKKSNFIFIAKYFKLNIFSVVLFLIIIVYNISSIYETFRYNPDIFSNKIALFAFLLIIVLFLQLYELIKRMKLQKKLMETEKNISFILDTTGYVLYHLELPERNYSYISPAITKLTGYTKEEINALKFSKIVKKSEYLSNNKLTYSDFTNIKKKPGSSTFWAEYLVKTKEGQYKWIEDISVTRTSGKNEITGTVGILRDITERKNYYSMINEELNNIKKYLEIAEVIFIVLDKNQDITLANKKACMVLGYNEGELTGKNWYDNFTPVKNREKRKKFYNEIFSGNNPVEEYQENIIVDRFGEEHLVAWRDAIIRDNRNNITAFISSGIDITEQKKTEESLRHERYLLQTLMDNIPDAIFFKDTESRYIKTSKGFRIKGIEETSSKVKKTDYDYFNHTYAKTSYAEEQNLLKTGIPIINKIEQQLFRDRTQKWVSTTKVPIYDSEGNISGLAGVSRDITEIKNAEEVIMENEQRWRYLLESSPISIVIITKGRIVYVNSEAVKIVGADGPEQLIGRRVYEFIPQEYLRELFDLAKKLNDKDSFRIPHTEGKIFRLNKEIIEVEGAAIPVIHMGLESVQVIFKDISERKSQEKIQQKIHEILHTANSELNLENLYSFIHQAVSSLMKAENFYIAIEEEATDMIDFAYYVDQYDSSPGVQKKQKGMTEYVLRKGESCLITAKQFDQLVVSGELETLGTPSSVWLGVPLKIQKKTIGVMVVQDYENEYAYGIKEQKILETIAFPVSGAIERKIVESEREKLIGQLKEINLSKDRLFSVISHDLRSPFNALLGFSGILISDFEKLTEKEINRYLTSINQTARNLYNLVNNLLEFSRFQTGKIEFNPKHISFNELVEKNIILLRGNAVKKNILLDYDIEDSEIFADEAMTDSIIQNLISNAIKFTNHGGKIEVTGRIITTSANPVVELSIKDDGVGMCPEALDNLFKADKVYSSVGTAKEPGSGLGLIITKEYIEKNGGVISVKSELDKGTEFILALPIAKKV